MTRTSRLRQGTIRHAIVRCIFHAQNDTSVWSELRPHEWTCLKSWLDTSGIALLFYAHLEAAGQMDTIPRPMELELATNLRDNISRMQSMIGQADRLNRSMAAHGVDFALLKGFSLWPHSVPRPELRSQLDLDFLIHPDTLPQAQAALAAQEFHLHARSGSSYEYKTSADPPSSLRELYKNHPCYSVELHAADSRCQRDALQRRKLQYFRGARFPVLADCDLFLGQARHLYKHLCSPCFRVAHLIEFGNHLRFKAWDDDFWDEIQQAAILDSATALQLGVCLRFTERCLDTAAPQRLAEWTSEPLPGLAALWVERYALRLLAQNFPGSKVYLLLQRDLEAARPSSMRTMSAALLPRRLPVPIMRSHARGPWFVRLRRYIREIAYVLSRLRFHVRSGVAFAWELPRWRRAVSLANKAMTFH